MLALPAWADDRKPVIGVEADVVVDQATGERKAVVDEHYLEAIRKAGATPLVLSPLEDDPTASLDKVDGIVIPGGKDVPPALYGEKALTSNETVDPDRLAFGQKLIKGAIERGVPLLGICYGSQLLDVVLGGKLLQDIPKLVGKDVVHRAPGAFPTHDVTLEPGSRLSDLGKTVTVNSNHHQSVETTGRGLRVAARAPDGVVEAVEAEDPHVFVLGVQWHPERMGDDPAGLGIFKKLVAAARERNAVREAGIPLDVTRVAKDAPKPTATGSDLARERAVTLASSRGFTAALDTTVREHADEER